MTALPKRKLCWNCEGNISRELDNCPYCGVYVHPSDPNHSGYWNPSYTQQEVLEEAPPPLYSIQEGPIEDKQNVSEKKDFFLAHISLILQREIFPILFLMSGSIFFLFGLILFLFAEEGSLTLRWNGSLWLIFALISAPCLAIGWKLLDGLEEENISSPSKVVANLAETHSFHDE